MLMDGLWGPEKKEVREGQGFGLRLGRKGGLFTEPSRAMGQSRGRGEFRAEVTAGETHMVMVQQLVLSLMRS